jgi:hypothetical protein
MIKGIRQSKGTLPKNNKSPLPNALPNFELHVKAPQITDEAQSFIVHFFAPNGVFTPVKELRKPINGFQFVLFDVDIVNTSTDTILFSVNDFFAKNQDGKEIMADNLIELQEYLPIIAGFPVDGKIMENLSFKTVLKEGEVRMIPIVVNVSSLYEIINFTDSSKGCWPSRKFLISPSDHKIFSFLTVIKKTDNSFYVNYKNGNSIKIPIH